MAARYYPQIFDVVDTRAAKAIILTDEGPGADPDQRWERETPYVLELLRIGLPLSADSVVLDYGCGIGRIAKAMIAATGCSVIGLDISPSMRILAVEYVASDRFMAVSPVEFDLLLRAGLRVHAAIAVWVLQHCFAPAHDIARLRASLMRDGRAFVLNMPKRAIPATQDAAPHDAKSGEKFFWASDNLDVAALLRAAFRVDAHGAPDKSRAPNMADVGAYWMHLAAV